LNRIASIAKLFSFSVFSNFSFSTILQSNGIAKSLMWHCLFTLLLTLLDLAF
jgi:hypothetical protein